MKYILNVLMDGHHLSISILPVYVILCFVLSQLLLIWRSVRNSWFCADLLHSVRLIATNLHNWTIFCQLAMRAIGRMREHVWSEYPRILPWKYDVKVCSETFPKTSTFIHGPALDMLQEIFSAAFRKLTHGHVLLNIRCGNWMTFLETTARVRSTTI